MSEEKNPPRAQIFRYFRYENQNNKFFFDLSFIKEHKIFFKDKIKLMTLRGQTVRWIGAQFCVCMFLNSLGKPLNIFQNVCRFHLQIFRGFRVQTPVT